MEINNENSTQKTTPRKRRNFQVKLIFQEKIYSKNGLANAQIREQLLKEMLTDRADDLAALPMEIYYTYSKHLNEFNFLFVEIVDFHNRDGDEFIGDFLLFFFLVHDRYEEKKHTIIFRVYIFNFIEKFASEDIHHNVHKGSVVTPSNKDQLQMMLKEQQQEPFDNGQMSSAENISEDNGVEQSTSMTVTHEISSADILDHNQQSSIVDDIDCKVIIIIYLRRRSTERKRRVDIFDFFPWEIRCRYFFFRLKTKRNSMESFFSFL